MGNFCSHAPSIVATQLIEDHRFVAVNCGVWEMIVARQTLSPEKIDRAERGKKQKGKEIKKRKREKSPG
jgi:hypothetical protein